MGRVVETLASQRAPKHRRGARRGEGVPGGLLTQCLVTGLLVQPGSPSWDSVREFRTSWATVVLDLYSGTATDVWNIFFGSGLLGEGRFGGGGDQEVVNADLRPPGRLQCQALNTGTG